MVNKSKRPLVGYIVSLSGGASLIVMVILLLVHYQKAKFATTLEVSFVLVFWDLLVIALLGLAVLVGYLVSTVKTNVIKTKYTVTLFVVIGLAVVLLLVGIIGVNSNYREYSTWTREKWISASDNHDYRGLLSKSFMDQCNLDGYTKDQVGYLLGSPDRKSIIRDFDPKPHAAVTSVGKEKWVYDLGYYYDYMDPSTLEVYFDGDGIVYQFEIVNH